MKNIYKIFTVVTLGFSIVSCSTILPIQATNNKVNLKKGTSTNSCLFAAPIPGQGPGTAVSYGICFNKKYGIIEAAKKGGIDKVGSVDLKSTNYLLFTKYELIVTGE